MLEAKDIAVKDILSELERLKEIAQYGTADAFSRQDNYTIELFAAEEQLLDYLIWHIEIFRELN